MTARATLSELRALPTSDEAELNCRCIADLLIVELNGLAMRLLRCISLAVRSSCSGA